MDNKTTEEEILNMSDFEVLNMLNEPSDVVEDIFEMPIEENTGVILTEEQTSVISDVYKGKNLLIIGKGGVGKSYLIRELVKEFPDTAVTAMTGVAALNVGGTTIHRWSGHGVSEDSIVTIANRIIHGKGNKSKIVFDNLTKTKRLIIDEVSMMDFDFFNRLDSLFRIVRNNPNEPFGGIQILLFGDFLQLPPIEKWVKGQPKRDPRFCFETETWKECQIEVHELTKVFRQSDDVFIQILNRLRVGDIRNEDLDILYTRFLEPDPEKPRPILLFPLNKDVDAFNDMELDKLDSEEETYYCKDYYNSELSYDDRSFYKKTIEAGNAVPILRLKVGARVMMLRNTYIDHGIINGSLGTVKELYDDSVLVDFDNGASFEVTSETWAINEPDSGDKPTVLASRKQIPLKLAYASSVHKAQGCTFDSIITDVSNCFSYGQVYVVLSRVKSLEGLYLKGFDPYKIKAHPKAVDFYEKHALIKSMEADDAS